MSPEGSSSGLDPLFSRRSVPGMLHPWARAGSRRFPGDPSQAFALLQDPGRADTTSPLAVVPTPPPDKPNRRPQRVHNREANTGLQLPLSTLHERRHRLPCKTCLRLAGCASTGRVSNPLGRFERFQVTSILLSRTSPVARLILLKKGVVMKTRLVKHPCPEATIAGAAARVPAAIIAAVLLGITASPARADCNPAERINASCYSNLQDATTAAIAANQPLWLPAGTYVLNRELVIDYAPLAATGFQIISDGAVIDATATGLRAIAGHQISRKAASTSKSKARSSSTPIHRQPPFGSAS